MNRGLLRSVAVACVVLSAGLIYVGVSRQLAANPEAAAARASNDPAALDSVREELWFLGQRGKALRGDLAAMAAIADYYGGSGQWHHDEVLSCAWMTLLVDTKGASARPNEKTERADVCGRLEAPRRAVAERQAQDLSKVLASAR